MDTKLRKWDVIIADSLVQHDMDARPIFDKYVIPALNRKKILPDIDFIDQTFSRLNKMKKGARLRLAVHQILYNIYRLNKTFLVKYPTNSSNHLKIYLSHFFLQPAV